MKYMRFRDKLKWTFIGIAWINGIAGTLVRAFVSEQIADWMLLANIPLIIVYAVWAVITWDR